MRILFVEILVAPGTLGLWHEVGDLKNPTVQIACCVGAYCKAGPAVADLVGRLKAASPVDWVSTTLGAPLYSDFGGPNLALRIRYSDELLK